MAQKIKTGDTIKVMRGKQAGEEGQVKQVINKVNKRGKKVKQVVVEGVNVVKRHQKPNPILNTPGGIVSVEKPIDISNVMIVDPKTKQPTRVGFETDTNGKKQRISKKSGEKLD